MLHASFPPTTLLGTEHLSWMDVQKRSGNNRCAFSNSRGKSNYLILSTVQISKVLNIVYIVITTREYQIRYLKHLGRTVNSSILSIISEHQSNRRKNL
jgi:hypothetical protein